MSREVKSSAGPRALEKQQLILDSALNEFVSHGYSAASMDRISDGAGVSKATVYSYFRDKKQLYGALIDRKVESACFVDMSSLPAPGSLPISKHVERLIDVLCGPLNAPESEMILHFMRMTISESGRFPELAQMFVQRVEKPINEGIGRYLHECGIKKEDAESMAWIISGTLIYHLIINRVMSGGTIMPMPISQLTGMLDKLISTYVAQEQPAN